MSGEIRVDGPFALFSGNFVWTNGAESSSKVSLRLVLVHGWLFPAITLRHDIIMKINSLRIVLF